MSIYLYLVLIIGKIESIIMPGIVNFRILKKKKLPGGTCSLYGNLIMTHW